MSRFLIPKLERKIKRILSRNSLSFLKDRVQRSAALRPHTSCLVLPKDRLCGTEPWNGIFLIFLTQGSICLSQCPQLCLPSSMTPSRGKEELWGWFWRCSSLCKFNPCGSQAMWNKPGVPSSLETQTELKSFC